MPCSRRHRLCLVAALLILAVPTARAAPVAGWKESLALATCSRQAGEYTAVLDGKLVLERAFLEGAEDELVRESILQQLHYFWGYLRTNAELRAAMELVLSAEAPDIRIVARTPARYGRDLVLDWKETSPRLKIEDRYTVAATRRGFTRSDDPALVVEYQARFPVAMCGEARPPEWQLEVPLPDDPWLLYWHVPARERRLMRYFDETAVTNPCSDDDFADLPHPFYYWYDWQPDRHGPDADGKPFDCRGLLASGKDFFPRRFRFTRVATASGDLGELGRALGARTGPLTADQEPPLPKGDAASRPLLATVLIGALDHEWPDLALDPLRREIGAGGPRLDARANAVLARPVKRERAAEKFLRLLADLPAVMAVARYRSALEGGYLRVTVEGVLRRSRRALRLQAFLGPTDIFGPSPPTHWGILRRALAGDDVVIYGGHSGLGENFRLARIEDNLKLAPEAFAVELERARFQLVAFLSCYSYMYFGQDLIAAGARRADARRAFLFTGTGYTKGDRGALAVLDLVDGALAPPAAERRPLRFVDAEDFLLLKEFRHAPEIKSPPPASTRKEGP